MHFLVKTPGFIFVYNYDIHIIHMEVILLNNNALVIVLKQSNNKHLPSASTQNKQHIHN